MATAAISTGIVWASVYIFYRRAGRTDDTVDPLWLHSIIWQESKYNPGVRSGAGARGLMQFIPETAIKYGLQLGPLYELGRPDPADDRHNFEKSTEAAVRYLRFIYTTDAQASALLVMASYNWGEGKVIPLIQSLPATPRERNFWHLLSTYQEKIPKETYDYVFYILAAAVIGENPRLFGFDFDNPLRHLDQGPRV